LKNIISLRSIIFLIIIFYLFFKYKKLKLTFFDYKINNYNFSWGLGIGDWGLGIGDWGLGQSPIPQSPIPNPQSPTKFILFKLILHKIYK
jgi:hypothetical protein